MGVFIVFQFVFAHKILQGNIDERAQYARYEEGPFRISKIEVMEKVYIKIFYVQQCYTSFFCSPKGRFLFTLHAMGTPRPMVAKHFKHS